MSEAAAVGLSVRTGRAVVVVLRGTRRLPLIVVRYDIQLADPWVPESLHPYHHELGDSGPAGGRARRRGCQAAQKASRRAVRALVGEMRSHGLEPCGAGVVVSSLVDPVRVSGAHPRAHAEEGKLYREAVEAALRICGLRFTTLLEKNLRAVASERLGRTARQIDATLKAFSRKVGTPWRAPEKQAALAAWLVLSPAAETRVRRGTVESRNAKGLTEPLQPTRAARAIGQREPSRFGPRAADRRR